MDEEKKEEKKSLGEWLDEHPKSVFWTRFVLWAVLACVLPFTFIVWRFELFKTISKMQIGGWGLIAIIIVAVFVFVLLRYLKLALSTKYSFTAQIIGGICKVLLPLIVVYVVVYNIKSNVDLFLQALGCVILCETAAIPINPMPKWVYEKQKDVRDEERKDTVDYLLDGFFKRKKESEE